MADISSIRLPVELEAQGISAGEAKKLKSYLYQLTEQLRYVLANLDEDNLSATYNAGQSSRAVQITALTEQQRAQFAALRRQVISTAEKIAHEYQSAIEVSDSRLRAEVQEKYTAQSTALENSTESLRTSLAALLDSELTQSSREITARFGSVQQLARETRDALEQWQQLQQTCIRMSADGVEIGKSEDGVASPYTMRIDNEKLAFLRYGTEVACLMYNRLYVTAVEAADRVSIGGSAGEGFYDFITTATGLGIKWRAN